MMEVSRCRKAFLGAVPVVVVVVEVAVAVAVVVDVVGRHKPLRAILRLARLS
jgi:hypothetical protein